MEIVVQCEVSSSKQYGKVVKMVIVQASKHVPCPRGTTISVSIIGDAKMRMLNRKYRDKDHTANVLSFSTHDSYFMIPDSQNDLGDIFISLPEARREAKKYGWTLQYEIARLALHGFLHVLGYDHSAKKDRVKMEKFESKILAHYA